MHSVAQCSFRRVLCLQTEVYCWALCNCVACYVCSAVQIYERFVEQCAREGVHQFCESVTLAERFAACNFRAALNNNTVLK